MNAIYLHGPGDLRIDDVEQYPVKEETVAVDIEYTGICGSDLHEYDVGPVPIRAESTNHSIPDAEWDEYLPKPMGHEVAGTVSEVGDRVENVAVGDRVALNMVAGCHDCRYCAAGKYHLCERGDGGVVMSRGFAERIVVPASMAAPVPEDVSLKHAALAEPLGVSLRGVGRSEIGPTDRIAVFGAGPIGLGVIAGGATAGAREIYVSEPREPAEKPREHSAPTSSSIQPRRTLSSESRTRRIGSKSPSSVPEPKRLLPTHSGAPLTEDGSSC